MVELVRNFPEWLKITIVLVPVLSFAVGACAFLLNFRQAFLNNKIARSKIISDTLQAFMGDATIQNAFYKVEYGEFKYSTTSFHRSEEEKEIDKLLRLFSNLAMMWKNGLLTLIDIYPIQYYVVSVGRQ